MVAEGMKELVPRDGTGAMKEFSTQKLYQVPQNIGCGKWDQVSVSKSRQVFNGIVNCYPEWQKEV